VTGKRRVGPRWRQRLYLKLPTDLVDEIERYRVWRGLSDWTFPYTVERLLRLALQQIEAGYGGRPWNEKGRERHEGVV
jgi:hypothetical protein